MSKNSWILTLYFQQLPNAFGSQTEPLNMKLTFCVVYLMIFPV
jgi:hypothetical protein